MACFYNVLSLREMLFIDPMTVRNNYFKGDKERCQQFSEVARSFIKNEAFKKNFSMGIISKLNSLLSLEMHSQMLEKRQLLYEDKKCANASWKIVKFYEAWNISWSRSYSYTCSNNNMAILVQAFEEEEYYAKKLWGNRFSHFSAEEEEGSSSTKIKNISYNIIAHFPECNKTIGSLAIGKKIGKDETFMYSCGTPCGPQAEYASSGDIQRRLMLLTHNFFDVDLKIELQQLFSELQNEMLVEIFRHLRRPECLRRVSKLWILLIDTYLPYTPPDYTVIDKRTWEKVFGFGCIGEVPPFPEEYDSLLDSPDPYEKNKRVKDNYIVAFIPSTIKGEALTAKSFVELIGNRCKIRAGYSKDLGFFTNQSYSLDVFGTQTYPSRWILMRKKGARVILKEEGYDFPDMLSATVCLIMHYLDTGKVLNNERPILCRDQAVFYRAIIKCEVDYYSEKNGKCFAFAHTSSLSGLEYMGIVPFKDCSDP